MRDFAIQNLDQDCFGIPFLECLEERRNLVAQHALAAWDGETTDGINTNLAEARIVLQQITQEAIPAGFHALGMTAQHCDAQMLAHLDGPYSDLAICPGEVIWWVDMFAQACQEILDRYFPQTYLEARAS
ncbi:phosphorelay protein [Sulfitobacter sp.]|uniref:phosphorelay protein n=1 Tax=Sulfitobacter sp. TaxID=1903071 RepID=UPI0030015050